MKLLVISSAPFIKKADGFYAYSPYIKEMEVWQRNIDKIQFCCPILETKGDLLNSKISFEIEKTIQLKAFDFTTFFNSIKSFPAIFNNIFILFKAIQKADALHLRCPGNIGLLASLVQILFPSKKKSAKYAGNWDSKAKQPLSYKIQKWILKNTFLTKNMQVLVYGKWENQSKNIKPFFTATYAKSEIIEIEPRNLNGKIKMIFVGTLSKGKQPLYAVKVVEALRRQNFDVELSVYGDGNERFAIEEYVSVNHFSSFIFLKGNTDRASMKKIYQESHCLILPSKSEGWPKVVAEAMFWGCLPIATPISCVPNMLNFGERGILLTENLQTDVTSISDLLSNQEEYNKKIKEGINWSRQFTIDKFEQEIKNILKS
ncbi:glycosyltransferase [Flavobacterium sp.]|uniref:glycosyltransferase n=1 Tax=Flavobacterium sp. TaxID=239 RepID=UPI002604E343|nr:glycosyltransferase [Flavobacterium sp.]